MNKTWKPIVAGILEILAGLVTLASALIILQMLLVMVGPPWKWHVELLEFIIRLLGLLIPFIAVFIGIVSMVGGVYAIKRRRWRLAFVGAICTVPLFFSTLFGLGARLEYIYDVAIHYSIWLPLLLSAVIITLVVLSKREFTQA